MTKQEKDLRLLDYICTYLFGERWQNALAEALNLNPRTVRSWKQGRNNVTPPVWRQIGAMVEKKVARAPTVREAMAKKLATLQD